MKIVFIFTLLLICSCGSLTLVPRGCKTDGVWGEDIGYNQYKEYILEKSYLVWFLDKEINLKDVLKEKNFNCSEVKKLRVEMKSTFFVKRDLKIILEK